MDGDTSSSTSSAAPQGGTVTATALSHSARAEAWREELGSAFGRLTPVALEERTLDGRMAGTHLGPVATYLVSGTPQIVRRTPAAVRQMPMDLYKICVQQTGRAIVRQGDHEVVLEPGQMAIYDTGRPYELRLEQAWTCAVMAFPRDALGLPGHVLTTSMEHAYALDDGPGAVLAGFVTSAVTQAGSIRSTAAGRLGEAGLHLLAGTLSEAAAGEGDSAADAQRLQILSYVRAHLMDPDLSHSKVAAAHHMAPRTLHRLFEHEPCTVTDYIRSLRLEAVYRDLRDPLLANRSIAAVAARWCFPDQAHFTRAFRARFGTTPAASRRHLGASGGADDVRQVNGVS
jgi:AraC-like DNA-binding protein